MSASYFNPGFGSVLRGLRLGYGWSAKHQCFIRISDTESDLIRIDLAPPKQIPSRAKGEFHRCWWDEPEVLDLAPALRNIRGVKKPISFFVNQEGELAA